MSDENLLLRTALTWSTCGDKERLVFKEWVLRVTKCCFEGEVERLNVICILADWVGDVKANVLIQTPDGRKLHYLLLSDPSARLRLLGGPLCPHAACTFCK